MQGNPATFRSETPKNVVANMLDAEADWSSIGQPHPCDDDPAAAGSIASGADNADISKRRPAIRLPAATWPLGDALTAPPAGAAVPEMATAVQELWDWDDGAAPEPEEVTPATPNPGAWLRREDIVDTPLLASAPAARKPDRRPLRFLLLMTALGIAIVGGGTYVLVSPAVSTSAPPTQVAELVPLMSAPALDRPASTTPLQVRLGGIGQILASITAPAAAGPVEADPVETALATASTALEAINDIAITGGAAVPEAAALMRTTVDALAYVSVRDAAVPRVPVTVEAAPVAVAEATVPVVAPPPAEEPQRVALAEPQVAIATPAPPAPSPTNAAITYQATTLGAVNLRAAGNRDARTLTVVPEGAIVAVTTCSGWCRVTFEGTEGYIYETFLTAARPAPAPPAAVPTTEAALAPPAAIVTPTVVEPRETPILDAILGREGGAQPTATAGATTNDFVNLRAAARSGSTVVAVLPPGTAVEVIQCDGWCQVRASGVTGFVYSTFLNR